MFSAEEQQVQICLLKSSLSGIENDLVNQRASLPGLDDESEQQYRETMNALRVSRSLNAELDKLKQDNVRLEAKRLHMKIRCEEMTRALEAAASSRRDVINSLHDEERDEELLIRKYEDSLREKADRFRKARIFYDEDEMSNEIRKILEENSSLEAQAGGRQAAVDELRQTLANLTTDVPEDILDIIGKNELENKLKEETDKCASLEEEHNSYLHSQK